MTPQLYRYRFDAATDMEEVRELVIDAILAAEDLHGPARIRLDCRYFADELARAVVVDARTEAGQTMAVLFTGLLLRHYQEDAFMVDRLDPETEPRTPAAITTGGH